MADFAEKFRGRIKTSVLTQIKELNFQDGVPTWSKFNSDLLNMCYVEWGSFSSDEVLSAISRRLTECGLDPGLTEEVLAWLMNWPEEAETEAFLICDSCSQNWQER